MADIKVHILNFHSIFSHIEIVLENTSVTPVTYLSINQWNPNAGNGWEINEAFDKYTSYKDIIAAANSKHSFMIQADPELIQQEWRKYWYKTEFTRSILGNNCAVATQWFLTEFANVPKPNLSNVSFNHLAFGILWPSFVPCPVTLPGRVMSNAKFYLKAEEANQYSNLYLGLTIAANLVVMASAIALTVALHVLTAGLSTIAIAACVVVGVTSSMGFFGAYNKMSAKRMVNSLENIKEPDPLGYKLVAA